MSGPIEFSSEALEAFKSQLAKNGTSPKAIRLGVRGGSCNGLQYAIEFDHEAIRTGDVEWQPEGWDNDITFRVDKKSLLYLSGTKVTWTKTLMREGFDFVNPNESSRCGCGQSFSPK